VTSDVRLLTFDDLARPRAHLVDIAPPWSRGWTSTARVTRCRSPPPARPTSAPSPPSSMPQRLRDR